MLYRLKILLVVLLLLGDIGKIITSTVDRPKETMPIPGIGLADRGERIEKGQIYNENGKN